MGRYESRRPKCRQKGFVSKVPQAAIRLSRRESLWLLLWQQTSQLLWLEQAHVIRFRQPAPASGFSEFPGLAQANDAR
jgi:hypothetical protein